MTLRQKQSIFCKLVGRLIQRAYRTGYELTLGDAQRTKAEAIRLGFPESLHVKRLAIDFNLFKNGHYQSSTGAHAELGKWWEDQSTDKYECCWGGRFGDGNHYSIRHGNVR